MFSFFFLFFFFTVFHFLYKLKEKGSLRCSFYFHVENSRATADASNERSLSASRDIRSIRIAITIQSQQHQRESLLMVSLFRAIVELPRYDDIISMYIFLRCQRQHSYFGQFRCVPYRYLFLSKILTWPLFTLEKLCGFTQPAINLGSMLKHQMSVWAMPEWYFVLSCCIRPLFSVVMMQNDIGIMLQKIMLSKQALRAVSYTHLTLPTIYSV